MRHHIVLWKWKQQKDSISGRYTHEHVNVMEAMLRRSLIQIKNFRIVCVTDDPSQISTGVDFHPLWKDLDDTPNICGKHLPSCYRRLKLFDPKTQKDMGIDRGDRITSIDLDAVIINPIDHMLARQERFVGWGVRGSHHPTVFNGSMWSFTAGDHEEVWADFDPERSPMIANKAGYLGSDQAWLSYKLVKAAGSSSWTYPNICSYPRDVYRRPIVPKGAQVIMFHGRKKPWHAEVQERSPWVKNYWRL